MKIFKKTVTFLPVLLLLFTITLLLPSKTEAAQFHFSSYTLAPEESINEDVYIVGEEVIVNGVVNGDVIAFGDLIQVNGTITGDVYLMGSKVDVNANIYGNLFIFSNNATVEGLITQNIYTISTFLNYSADSQSDMFGLFLEGTLKGSVGDDMRVAGMRTSIESIVRGDLVLISDQYTTDEENIIGEIYDKDAIQAIAAEQGVDLDKSFDFEMPNINIFGSWQGRLTSIMVNFLSMLLVGFIIIMLSPIKTYKIQERITGSSSEFLKSLAAGFLVMIFIPLPIFILFITIIGTPAAILIIGILFFIMVFGTIWIETAFGKEILEFFGIKEYRPFKSFLIGRTLTVLVNIIPIVRGFYNITLSLVTLGAIARMKRGYYLIGNEQAREIREKSKKKTPKKKSTTKKTSSKKK